MTATQVLTDAETRDLVEKQLEWAPQVPDAPAIGVAVHHGVVTLAGQVSSYAEKRAAGHAALATRGVSAVANELLVRLPSQPRTDSELAETARNLLKWNVHVPKDAVDLEVNDHVITLTGTVPWDFQRVEAAHAIGRMPGVKAVVNLIALTPRVDGLDTATKIRQAIIRNATSDADTITVDVIGTKAILRGQVSSLAEIRQATRAAWGSPHVAQVDNQITVRPA